MRSTYYGNYRYMDRVEEQRYRRIARARQVKRQKLLIIIGAFITIAFIVIFSVRASADTASGDNDSFGTKQYKSVMIYCRDTVESIAEDNYGFGFTSVEQLSSEIRSINHISVDEALIPGNYIVVPYYISDMDNPGF